MAGVIAALASCLVIVGFTRALGDAQCDASGAKCAGCGSHCGASCAKNGDSYLQRARTFVAAGEGIGGFAAPWAKSATHDACAQLASVHKTCGNVLKGMKAKGCSHDKIDCTATDPYECKLLCDGEPSCKSFAIRSLGCQLCQTDGTAVKPDSDVKVYSAACAATLTAPPPPVPPPPSAIYDHVPNTNCYEEGSGVNIGDKIDGETVSSCAEKCDASMECTGYLIGVLSPKWRRSGRCFLKKDIDLDYCGYGYNKWDMYVKAVLTPAPTPMATVPTGGTFVPTAAPTSRAYFISGIGMCRDGRGKYPSWGWASTTEQSAIDACDAEPTCSGYGYTKSGKYQFFCSSTAAIGTCNNEGNGGEAIVIGNEERHSQPCMVAATSGGAREKAQDHYSKWMQELPGDVITASTYIKLGHCNNDWYDTKWKRHDAHAVGPQCKPPPNGFPAVIVLPGSGGSKGRLIMWQRLLAGRGIFGMGLDLCYNSAVYVMGAVKDALNAALDWITSTTWDKIPFFGGLQYGINPADISLMGYSGGAETINIMLYTTDPGMQSFIHGANKFKNLISVCGVKQAHANNQDMQHLNSDWPNYIAIQSDDDPVLPGAEAAAKFVSRLKNLGLNAFLIRYWKGGHHPFKPSMFYELSQFIGDPQNYEQVSYPMWNDGEIEGSWEQFSNSGKACYGGSVKPLKMMEADLWNGEKGAKVCRLYCLQVEGCAGYDLLDPRGRHPGKSDSGTTNCVLYGDKCENPRRRTNVPSEFLTTPFTGMASASYCRLPANKFGYKMYDLTECGQGSTDVAVLERQTSVSCSKECDDNAECTGFQVAIAGGAVFDKNQGRCHLKKDFVIDQCRNHAGWAVYLKE